MIEILRVITEAGTKGIQKVYEPGKGYNFMKNGNIILTEWFPHLSEFRKTGMYEYAYAVNDREQTFRIETNGKMSLV